MKKLPHWMTGCAAAALLLVAGAALAANAADAQRRYQEERAVCLAGASNQDRATCLREAGAALQEANRGQLPGGDERSLGRNRMMRCTALPEPDRQDCAMRMQGQGSASGSAAQGGILRELARPAPAN